MKRKDKCKAKTTGSIMVSAILAIFVWIGIAQSMAIIANSGFKSIKSGRTAIQAQQYADISIDRLKNINYDELDTAGAHTRAVISGLSTTDWEDEVTIGAESTIAGSDDVKQRIATVNVYKTGDTLPRYTVEVPLSSQSNNIDKMQYPDWENGIELSPNIPHVIEKNGWIHWQLISSNTNNKNIILFINGKLISWVTAYKAATYYSDDSAFIPVTNGDIVYSQGSPAHFTFYPCR